MVAEAIDVLKHLAEGRTRLPPKRARSWGLHRLAAHAALRSGLDISLVAQELGRRHIEFDPSNSSRFGPRRVSHAGMDDPLIGTNPSW